MTELATEMPRCFSISIQSLVAWRVALRAFTLPAMWIAPANSSSFSVRVVLPASGWEMMAKVRRRAVSTAMGGVLIRRFYATGDVAVQRERCYQGPSTTPKKRQGDMGPLRVLAAIATMAIALPIAAAQRTETITLGSAPA